MYHLLLWYSLPIYFTMHFNYVVHNKLKLQFASKNSHILLDPPLNLRFDKSIRSRVFEFSWGSVVTPTSYTYPNLLNKKASTPFERKYHLVRTIFLVFVDACATSHSGWWRYAFKSSSRTCTIRRAWRSTVRLGCFSTAARRRTA